MQEFLDKIGVNINFSFSLIFLSLIWVRTLGMLSVVPFLFGKPVPRYVIVAASIAMALFAYPALVPKTAPTLESGYLPLIMLYVKEVFYGMTIGLAVSILFHAFAAVGQMIDNQRGASIARLLIPQLAEQGSISGAFLFQFGVVIYLVFGGHLIFFDAFFRSFQSLPVLSFPTAGPGLFPLMDLFIKITGEVIYIALQMSAPVIIVILIADIILGIANRVAQQINVWELGFQVKGVLGILLLFISLTMVGDQIVFYANKSNHYAEQVIELLQGRLPPDMAPPVPLEEEEKLGVPEVKALP